MRRKLFALMSLLVLVIGSSVAATAQRLELPLLNSKIVTFQGDADGLGGCRFHGSVTAKPGDPIREGRMLSKDSANCTMTMEIGEIDPAQEPPDKPDDQHRSKSGGGPATPIGKPAARSASDPSQVAYLKTGGSIRFISPSTRSMSTYFGHTTAPAVSLARPGTMNGIGCPLAGGIRLSGPGRCSNTTAAALCLSAKPTMRTTRFVPPSVMAARRTRTTTTSPSGATSMDPSTRCGTPTSSETVSICSVSGCNTATALGAHSAQRTGRDRGYQ